MKIEILGMGCAKCDKLYKAAEDAINQTGVEAELVKVKDIMEIAQRGVLMTPALVIDGEVKMAGKVPKPEEIVKLIS